MGAGRNGQTRLWTIIVVLVVIAGAVGAWASVDPGAPAPKSAPEVEWPAAIAPTAHRVEEIRGLRFRRPVPVHFVHESASASASASAPTISARTRAALEAAIEPAVVFGLVDGRNDVATLVSTGSGVAGVYSPRAHAIRIYVPERTAFARSVLAHELTHALEDQHFPEEDRADSPTLTRRIAEMSVVEGSAMLVEQRYSDGQWSPPSWTETGEVIPGVAADVFLRRWEWFAANADAPYVLGAAYVDAAILRGDLSWDTIIVAPPLSDVAIVDPLASSGSVWGTAAPASATPGSVSSQPLAAFEGFLLLASRVDPASALDIVRRTSGATLVMGETGGRRCGALTLTTTMPDDIAMTATLDRWVAAAGPANASHSSVPSSMTQIVEPARTPGGEPQVQLVPKPGSLLLTSCRGAATVAPGSMFGSLAQLGARNEAIAHALRAHQPRSLVPCIAQGVLVDAQYRSEVQRAFDTHGSVLESSRARAYRRAVRRCGANP